MATWRPWNTATDENVPSGFFSESHRRKPRTDPPIARVIKGIEPAKSPAIKKIPRRAPRTSLGLQAKTHCRGGKRAARFSTVGEMKTLISSRPGPSLYLCSTVWTLEAPSFSQPVISGRSHGQTQKSSTSISARPCGEALPLPGRIIRQASKLGFPPEAPATPNWRNFMDK